VTAFAVLKQQRVDVLLFLSLLVVFVILQIAAKKFHPFLYWATIVASTTAGTTMADLADRSLGIGYAGGSLLLFACLMATLAAWYWTLGSISVSTVSTPKAETFYWAAITFSQTLGTALGDWMADRTGYEHGAFVFAAALAILAAAYFFTSVSRVFLFWAAFILTRPLGASLSLNSTHIYALTCRCRSRPQHHKRTLGSVRARECAPNRD
jgi:uncharacterized membrane-anchored protein